MGTRRGISHLSKKIACCAIGVYLVILAGILLSSRALDEPPKTETFGDLAGRFPARPTLQVQGETYAYRAGTVENLLVLGVDSERGREDGASFRGQADFLLLLSVDRQNKRVTPIAIDRDAMAEVQLYGVFGDPAGTEMLQLCLAHAFSGGAVTGGANTQQAVSRLLSGMPIAGYLTMNLSGIAALNDAVGGIEVTLEEDFSHLDAAMTKGTTLRLRGRQAELYVRGRMNTASGTNAYRVQRQMHYLTPLLERLAALMQEDVRAAERLLDTLDSHIESSLSRAELVRFAQRFSNYELAAPVVLPGTRRLGADRAIEFWLDADSTVQQLIDICYEKRE